MVNKLYKKARSVIFTDPQLLHKEEIALIQKFLFLRGFALMD